MRIIEAWRRSFLRHLAKGISIENAARMTNVGMDKVLTTKRRDPEFAKEIQELRQLRV